MSRLPAFIALFTAGLAARVSAQVAVSLSPFAGAPLALSVDGATLSNGAPLSMTAVLEKPAGFTAAAPATPAAMPDFRDAVLWRNPAWGIPAPAPLPDVDAMSIGLDFILSDRTGLMTVPAGDWGAVTLSVTRTAVGARPPITTEVAAADGAAGDLFVYFLPNMVLPPQFSDATYRALDSSEINIASPGTVGEMDAHDIYIPLTRMGPAVAIPLAATGPVTLYFSVTIASLGTVPAGWWGGSTPSGATVLSTTWTGTTWTAPAPFRTYAQLGLAATDELDAVAVDIVRSHMLFSTKNAGPAFDELMYFDLLGGGRPAIYRASNAPNDPVTKRIGLLRTDDVDAVSAMDPGSPLERLQNFLCGTHELLPLPFPRQLMLSAFRAPVLSNDVMSLHMSGWPPRTGPGPGFALFWIAAPQQPFASLTQIAVLPRNPASPFAGDPRSLQVPIPPDPGLWGLQVLFYAAAVDGGLQDIDVALPLLTYL